MEAAVSMFKCDTWNFVGIVESLRVLMRLCVPNETAKAFVPAPYLKRRSIVTYFLVKNSFSRVHFHL